MGQCPFHPKPYKTKASTFATFLFKRRSWLDGLYERSYKMMMGRVKMPGFDLYVVNDPEQVRRIMVEDVKNFPKSQLLHELLEPLLGASIFTTNDKVWKKQRELLRPSFEMTRVSKVFSLMRDATDDMMTKLANYQNGAIIEVDEIMTFVTADVIFRTILSSKLDEQEGKLVLEAFETVQEETTKTALRMMFCFPKWLSRFLGENKRLKAASVIRKILSDIIRPRYDNAQNDLGKYEDILSSLLQVVDAETDQKFTFEEILDQVSMLFLAGHETTASSLTWTLYILSISPKEQEKAYEEIIKVVGSGAFEIEHIKEMRYVTNIFKEALRLYPPVGFFARETREDRQMRDKLVKKGSGVVVAPWLIHRHEKFWKNPHEFDPTRYESKDNIKKDTYMPFGMGERICIGQGFAMQEAVLILANILRKYQLELEENFVPDIVGRLTIRSANGMRIKFTKREQ